MADEIRQVMTFDVAQALTNIDSLQKRISGLSRSLGTLAKRADAFNQFGTTASQALDNASRSFDRFGTLTQQTAKRAGDSVASLTVSFETLSRVVATQVVVRAMSALQRSVSQSVADFIEFDEVLSRIQTIAGGLGNRQFFGAEIRSISDQFNIPLLEVAEGVYEAISNQVIRTTDDVRNFGEEVALFAKGTGSDYASAVDLVSGALNSYGLATTRADNLTSQFFKTIDLGKVEAEQLTTAFGRVAPIASQLGISTAELNAGIATLTIGGVNAAESATQLRGAMTALVKPTDGMRRALEQLGVATAEDLIRSRGFVGALQALIGTTDGTTRGIAKLFENVRGLSGALSLAEGRADTYFNALKQIEQVDQSFSRSKGLEVLATDSQKVAQAAQQISNAFTTEIGSALVDIGANLLVLTNGAKGFIEAGKVLIPQVVAIGTGLTALAAVAAVGRLRLLALPPAVSALEQSLRPELIARYTAETQKLTAATTRLLGVLSAFAAAASLGDQLGTIISSFAFASANALKAAEESRRLVSSETNERSQEQLEDYFAKALRLEQEHVDKVRAAHTQRVSDALDANDEIVRNTESSLNKIVAAQQQRTNALKKMATDAGREIERSIERVNDLQRTIANEEFERSLEKLPDDRRSRALLQQAQALSRLRNVQPGEDQSRQLEDAIALVKRVREVAAEEEDSTKRRRGIAQADSLIVKLRNQQLDIEKKLQTAEEQRRQAALKAASEEQQKTNELKGIVKDIVGSLSIRDRKGDLLDSDVQEENAKKLQKSFGDLFEFVSNRKDVSVDELLNVASLQTLVNQQLERAEIQQLLLTPNALQGLRDQIKASEFEIDVVQGQVDDKKAASDASLLELQQSRLRTELFERNAADLKLLQEQANATITNSFLLDQGQRDILEGLASIADKGLLNATTLKALQETAKIVQGETDGTTLLDTALNRAAAIVQRNEQIKQLSQEAGEGLKTGAEATVLTYDQLILKAQELKRINDAAFTNLTTPSGPVAQQQHGGLMYLASGGRARGTDTIPAMLSPGEFVINAKSAGKFYSQLQAINAGVQPVYRNDGGSVTNVTVGDIHVQGGTTPRATARQIYQELDRQFRRGAIRKF